jgi:O-antigen/teichoic acid export membrane protein
MRLKTIFLNSIWFGVIPKITTVINVLLLPILTPFLTSEDYGIWGILSSYTAIAVSLYSLGLQMHLTNSYYEYKDKYNLFWGRLLSVFLITALIISFFLTFVYYYLIPEDNFITKSLISVCATFPVLFNSNSLLADHLYVLRGEPKQLVVRNLVSSLFGIFLLFICVYFFNLGYIGFIGSAAISSLVSFLLFIPPLWLEEGLYPRLEKNLKRLKYNLKLAFPVIPHALGFVLISSSSRIILNWHDVKIEDIGIFSNGYIIGDYITVITTAVVTSLVPKVQELYRNKNFNGYRSYYYFSQAFALVTVILFSLWMPELYKVLIRNEELQIANKVAQKICFANVVLPFYFFVSTTTFIEKESKQLFWLVFIPGLLNVTLCLIFVPYFGYEAVVYTTILAYWSQLLIPFLSRYYRDSVKLWLGNLSKILLILCIFSVTLFGSIYLSELGLLFKLLLSFGLMLLSVVALLKFKAYL